MKNYKTIIAIDPDIIKSGVAVLDVSSHKALLYNYSFPSLIEFLFKCAKEKNNCLIRIEAGWLNSISNFHTEAGRRGQRIAKNVGSNHQTGRHIAEMAEHFGLEVELKHPLIKCWKGRDGKITHNEICSITGYSGSTNQETRDALLLAWDAANLPIKVKV